MFLRHPFLLGFSLVLLAGCGGGIQSLSFAPLEPRSDFLVEVKTQAPNRPTVTVSQSVVAIDPGGDMPAVPEAEILALMKASAAQRGANYLLVEKLDTRWRRVYYGTGLKLSKEPTKGANECSHAEAVEALESVVKQAGRCLQNLSRSRKSLRARLDATLVVDGFGGLKAVRHTDSSSRDGMVRNCLLRPAARMSYGPSGHYTCNLSASIELQ